MKRGALRWSIVAVGVTGLVAIGGSGTSAPAQVIPTPTASPTATPTVVPSPTPTVVPTITPTPTPAPTAAPTPAPTPPPAPNFLAPKGFVGLIAEDTFATETARAADLRVQQRAGVTLLRQTFDWALIEKKRGKYSLAYHDRFVLDAARRGIRIMPILFNPPKFHSSRPKRRAKRGTYPPRKNASMARFARALSRRYGSRGTLWKANPSLRAMAVREWQIWNEPNLRVYWPPKPRPAAYAKMVKAVGKTIRRSDPKARILSAGVPNSNIGGSIKFGAYMKAFFRAGGGRAVQSIGIHPYSRTGSQVVAKTRGFRQKLDRLPGGRRKTLHITEMGWASDGPKSGYTVGAIKQALYIRQSIAGLSAQRKRLKLSGFVLYNWRDAKVYPGGKDFWGLHAGLFTLAGAIKPALIAFAEANAAIKR